tara:strand:- start:1058 stop:1321 length:264 start_codon:yes stop_codon:yes gene_type:complete
MKIYPLDLAELLQEEGYAFDEDEGEVYTEPNGKKTLLILLAALGQLNVRYNAEMEVGFFIPHWKCFDSMDGYCQEFPHEQQCKLYDV